MGLFGRGVGRICAVAAATTAKEMAEQVRSGLRETPTVELRLDWLGSDGERRRFLEWLRTWRRGLRVTPTFIATCRRQVGGGKFAASADAELAWLIRAGEVGCAWCDLEIESLRGLRERAAQELKTLPRILLSIHDFRRTPPLGPLRLSRNSGVAATKIAAQARTIGDSVRLLRFARHTRDCVAVAMGEVGLPARVLALREGSALAYAPVAQATAPGQVSLDQLKYLYRAHELTRRTQVFGVIGSPIQHSLSPLLHNTGFISAKADAVYLPFLVDDVLDFLKAAPEFGLRGFSVTLPHKQSILRHLDGCEPLAAEIGAVNTVTVRRDGSLHGCNTDYVGVLGSLEKKMRLRGSRVLIFGAGGAARAAAFALAKAGAWVGICARRKRPAQELARATGGEVIPRRALRSEFFDAIVNATPIGMHPREGVSPLEARELHCRIVMDLIYRPERTRLLELAARKGIPTVSGVEMFLAQGAAQWEMWMKRRAPEAPMRRAILSALRAERSASAVPRRSR